MEKLSINAYVGFSLIKSVYNKRGDIVNFLKKIKRKGGATTLVEILIVTPVILIIMFYGVGVYHMVQQQTYIEDVKFRMIQEMSRKGELTQADIDSKWVAEYERMTGVRFVNATPIPPTPLGELMSTVVVLRVEPALFSWMLGGEYETTASIYSEEGTLP